VAELEYKCTDYFAPEYERSIRWDDPEIAIEWPLATGKSPLLSEKDAAAPFLSSAETYT
jgi:dTDP-4-dehydrorhamnose 3,5-epimerase